LVLSMIMLLTPMAAAQSIQAAGDYSKEQMQNNMPPNHTPTFDKQKVEELLSLPPSAIDNKGIVERDLTNVGIPTSIAHNIVVSGFNANVVNAYLKSIGSSVLVSDNISPSVRGTCSCGYNMTTGVTVDGVANQIFSPSISTTSSSIANYVTKARGIGRYLFGYTSSSPEVDYIRSSYFLYGEHDCADGLLHEGIDIRYTENDHESFRTVCGGEVMAVNMGANGFGTLTVKHPTESRHIMFLHADSYTNAVQVGENLSGLVFIGYQGGRKGSNADYYIHHVHVESRDTSRLGPASDTDTTLSSYSPYDSLWSYVSSNYR